MPQKEIDMVTGYIENKGVGLRAENLFRCNAGPRHEARPAQVIDSANTLLLPRAIEMFNGHELMIPPPQPQATYLNTTAAGILTIIPGKTYPA